ncbi:DUF4159 domain-containing protein [Acetobacter lambici]|uniref:DUF4159 domain-containing protein n=1 Tax=Acetobacter lambici TaxID=1332824 RepID=A0ABT1EWE3_9PROT|nr:DUF4159 domain-containing protein [Acetobacter lambici]MCP1241070.1 DUF4159 domain-containing protein [Acetobacter lambici]MCP1257258.1 DUF4159 domain-containing protein [Acetobacter lambici]NHO55748.1 DUF4159 domain-containing protein [Acetobacter lambici]
MIFQSPTLLFALLSLPLVWWLLRATPPRARQQVFPPIAFLSKLRPKETEAARSPLWLLLLRLVAIGLLVVGFARPFIPGTRDVVQTHGPVLLVLDDGMLSAADWTDRLTTAQTIVDDAERTQSSMLVLGTAPQAEDASPVLTPQPATTVRQMLNSHHPSPWPVDRERAAEQILHLPATPFARVVYLADGVAQSGDTAFAQALRARGAVREIRFSTQAGIALAPATPAADGAMAHLITLPTGQPRLVHVVARATDGGTLAVVPVPVAANATQADVHINLPITVRNRIDTLAIQGVASAATTVLLDENTRLHPVGLLSSGGADTPLIGSVFYLRRALAPLSDLHEGNLETLLARPLSVLIAPDGTLAGAQSQKTVLDWIKNGGTLIRFAGPALAGSQHDTAPPPNTPDIAQDLLPVPLLDGARQLGGSMTWGTPQKLAPFEQASPFRGLDIPADVTVSRQVLASPSADLGAHVWARLADGTPLVTHAELGKGEVILFHVSSTADWSNLPLSGLFVSMLQRLTEHANGLNIPADNALLAPAITLDGEGMAGPPPPTARGIQGNVFATTSVSPIHPPGLYGPADGHRALNAATGLQSLQPAQPVGTITDSSGQRPDLPLGRYCLLGALVLLLLDCVAVGLMRAGKLLAPKAAAPLLALFAALGAHSPPLHAQDLNSVAKVPAAALETRLGYIDTGHDDVDDASRAGLQGLSDFVNARTSAVMGHPDAVHPGTDDLSYYPLLYWPITADATTTPAMTAALNTFMAHGGILLIDTQGQDGSTSSADTTFTADAPGTGAALRRVTTGLVVPPLVVMTDRHLLAHTFYLLHDFPGRYAGQPIWVAKEGDAENDDVSPVIIGSADWAHAWAVDSAGNTPFAVIPGGGDQRLQAYRFGLNTVIYALTGSYKADQVHVPMLLKRLEDKP